MFHKPQDDMQYDYEPQQSHHEEVETVVGPSVNVEGDFVSEGNIIVKGTVSGSVKTSQRLSVEEGAKILANVKAAHAIISGSVKGNLAISDRLELTSTAQVLGDISCAVLAIEPGALVHGKVSMKGMEDEVKNSGKRRMVSRGRQAAVEEDVDESEEVAL